MKKIVLFLSALLLALPLAWAVPAIRTPFQYTQPDGTVITLRLHGDEFFHWYTDESGQVVDRDADGFFRPSAEDLSVRAAEGAKHRSEQYIRWSSYENPPETNFGDRKVLCIIANFTDSTFVIPNVHEHFTNMLNQPGYSENGAIGSVRDYYMDNSLNQYRPQFDVFGPVDLSHTSAYYDENGAHLAILEAYEQMADQINIADYDTDNDGNIDMVLFYYPGHNQAEGAGEESIWPHQSTRDMGTMGGKNFNRYFCTSELRGVKGADPAAIGTTCHEFAHSLGLPDFYDTDYEENGGDNFPNDYAGLNYDLMAGGNYVDSGRRPPYLSSMERNMLGWMNYPELIAASGDYTLEPVQNNRGYQFGTNVEGEYFFMEYRNSQKWDSAFPGGLLVYHIDQSQRTVPYTQGYYGTEKTAKALWGTNKINAFFGHPCYYPIQTGSTSSDLDDFLFPGSDNAKSFIPMDWDGNQAGLAFSDIAHDGSSCTFTVSISSHRLVFGYVYDTLGCPIAGAEVSLTPSDIPFAAAPSLLSNSLITTTNEEGYYSMELEDSAYAHQILRAWKQGYVAEHTNLSISSLYNHEDIVLMQTGEGSPADLYRYDDSQKRYNLGSGGVGERAVAMAYSAEELSAMGLVGGSLRSVTFKVGKSAPENVEKTFVLVCFDDEMVLCKEIPQTYGQGSFIYVDLSGEHLTIPAGKEVFIGYGFTGMAESTYPFSGYLFATDPDGSLVMNDFLTPGGHWETIKYKNPDDTEKPYYAGFIISAEIVRAKDIEFSDLGVSYIKLEEGVPVVAVASGKSVRDITWTVDSEAMDTPTPVSDLPPGSHTYMARIRYYDGTLERVYLDLDI